MAETDKEKISRFIQFNEDILSTALSDNNRRNSAIHSKILLCSLFDSLAKSAFPHIRGNAERFKKLVSECSDWKDWSRVSLLHMSRLFDMEASVPPEFEDTEKWCHDEFSRRFPAFDHLLSVHVDINEDPEYEEAQLCWPRSNDENNLKLRNTQLCYLKHSHLLWLYRNSLVHEYRIPGKGVESMNSSTANPYYQKVSTVTTWTEEAFEFTNHWELVYPVGFFEELCRNAINCVAERHLRDRSNPFEAYNEGSYWIPDFNTSS